MAETAEKVTKIQTAAAARASEAIAGLFEDSARCQIELAYALEEFFGNRMHLHLEYSTMAQCIEEEFDVSISHVARLRKIAYSAQDLGYTQDQIVSIYNKVGHLSSLANYLGTLPQKKSIPNVVKDLRDLRHHHDGHIQWNISLSEREAASATAVLKKFGMKIDPETGRRSGVNAAHVALFAAARKTLNK